jgi:glyoxylate reductase
MALIFVTRKLPGNGISLLQQVGHEVFVNEKDDSLCKNELLQAVSTRPYEGVVSLLSDSIDEEFFKAVPNLKIVSNYAVGYNNIDIKKAQELNISVTNTPDVLTDTVAEFTIASMLAVVKRIPESERFLRAGKYKGWAPELFLGTDLIGKTLGILGAGRIGRGVAKKSCFGFWYEGDIQRCK